MTPRKSILDKVLGLCIYVFFVAAPFYFVYFSWEDYSNYGLYYWLWWGIIMPAIKSPLWPVVLLFRLFTGIFEPVLLLPLGIAIAVGVFHIFRPRLVQPMCRGRGS